jgi:hypothetical protein
MMAQAWMKLADLRDEMKSHVIEMTDTL